MSLYSKPIDKVDWTDVEGFCRERVAENESLDYKQDFPDHLENTICAMANTVGGLILIGVKTDSENKPVSPICGIPFKQGLSERVTSIILSNLTAPVFPEIQVAQDSTRQSAVVVIRVPQSDLTPHAVLRNTMVYVRTHDRNSPEEIASVVRIEWLLDRRRKCEELRESMLRRAEERFVAEFELRRGLVSRPMVKSPKRPR